MAGPSGLGAQQSAGGLGAQGAADTSQQGLQQLQQMSQEFDQKMTQMKILLKQLNANEGIAKAQTNA